VVYEDEDDCSMEPEVEIIDDEVDEIIYEEDEEENDDEGADE